MGFQITLEDEGKVMDQLALEIRTMNQEIKQKMADVEAGGKADAEKLHEEIEEVYV